MNQSVALKGYTGRRSEKLAGGRRLNMGHIFRQSLLEGIYSVAFGCTHKK